MVFLAASAIVTTSVNGPLENIISHDSVEPHLMGHDAGLLRVEQQTLGLYNLTQRLIMSYDNDFS